MSVLDLQEWEGCQGDVESALLPPTFEADQSVALSTETYILVKLGWSRELTPGRWYLHSLATVPKYFNNIIL